MKTVGFPLVWLGEDAPKMDDFCLEAVESQLNHPAGALCKTHGGTGWKESGDAFPLKIWVKWMMLAMIFGGVCNVFFGGGEA